VLIAVDRFGQCLGELGLAHPVGPETGR
jgi:hypothetical protein